MSNITELRHRVRNLSMLLDHPQLGLASWWVGYEAASRSILDFYGINVEKIAREAWDNGVEQAVGDAERAQRRREPVRSLVDDCCPDCGSLSPSIHYTPRDKHFGLCENIWHRRILVEGSQSCG